MIAIVDYGAGNLCSVRKAFDWLERKMQSLPIQSRFRARRRSYCRVWGTSPPQPVWAVWACVKPLGTQSRGAHRSWVSA